MILQNKLFTFYSEKNVSLMFLLWLLTLPFGASIVSFSIGFATIYPNLLISLILTPLGFRMFKSFSVIFKMLILLLFLLLVQSVILFPSINGKQEALFDIHSISLFLLFVFNLFSVYSKLMKENFSQVLLKGLYAYLYLLIIFGGIETMVGIHVEGGYTEKLSRGLALIHYTPIFLYDNPNDFLVYVISLTLLLLLVDKKLIINRSKIILILAIELFFAHMALSRFSILILITLMLYVLYVTYKDFFNRNNRLIISYSIISIILIFSVRSLYLGPMLITYFAKKNDPVLLKQTSEKIGEDVKLVLIKDTITPPLDSYTVRKNLMINGYKIAKSHPILGCGPGQFKYNLKKFESKYPIDNNYSPHNYAIELISQFGIIGAVLYLIPFVLLVYLFIILKHRNILFVLSIIYYYILSLIPSSFLYLDINWVFIGIIFIYSVDIINKGTRNLC